MIKIAKAGGDGHGPNYKEFIISSAADVSDLPTFRSAAPNTAEAGSVAYTQNMEHTYLLGADDIWREV